MYDDIIGEWIEHALGCTNVSCPHPQCHFVKGKLHPMMVHYFTNACKSDVSSTETTRCSICDWWKRAHSRKLVQKNGSITPTIGVSNLRRVVEQGLERASASAAAPSAAPSSASPSSAARPELPPRLWGYYNTKLIVKHLSLCAASDLKMELCRSLRISAKRTKPESIRSIVQALAALPEREGCAILNSFSVSFSPIPWTLQPLPPAPPAPPAPSAPPAPPAPAALLAPPPLRSQRVLLPGLRRLSVAEQVALCIKDVRENNTPMGWNCRFHMNDADGFSSTKETVSLVDPLSLNRISIPVRTVLCTHRQAFCARVHFENNFKVQVNMLDSWSTREMAKNLIPEYGRCPICQTYVSPFNLCVDAWFEKVLSDAPEEAKFAEFDTTSGRVLRYTGEALRKRKAASEPAETIDLD